MDAARGLFPYITAAVSNVGENSLNGGIARKKRRKKREEESGKNVVVVVSIR